MISINMNMPKTCGECKFLKSEEYITDYEGWKVHEMNDTCILTECSIVSFDKRDSRCPLVEVEE